MAACVATYKRASACVAAKCLLCLHAVCRLPYAVVSRKDTPDRVQTALRCLDVQRAESIAGVSAQQQLPGVLNNMIIPGALDAYIKPAQRRRSGPVGAAVIDFRRSYIANKGGSTNETASYDGSGQHKLHERRLLLSAECQIGKTGAYLALLLELQQTLRPSAKPAVEIAVLLPGSSITDGPPEAEDLAPPPDPVLKVADRY